MCLTACWPPTKAEHHRAANVNIVEHSHFCVQRRHVASLPFGRSPCFELHKKADIMETTWILITDAHRARCFERKSSDHLLNELADFVHPHASLVGIASGGDLTGAAGKGHGDTGHAGTQFEPRTEAHAKERALYAKQLASYLNTAVAEQRCNALVLIAPSPMLGELKQGLSSAAAKVLKHCVTSNLTHYTGTDLTTRVGNMLHMPD